MKKSVILGLMITLASCGVLPLPTVSIPDQVIPVTQALSAGDTTVYTTLETGGSTNLPIKNIRITGQTGLTSPANTQATAEVYVAPAALSGCLNAGETVICPTPQGELIGTLTLDSSGAHLFTLGPNERFGQAIKNGKVTIGLRLKSGTLKAGDEINLKELAVSSRL